jgi:hypothetical protein
VAETADGASKPRTFGAHIPVVRVKAGEVCIGPFAYPKQPVQNQYTSRKLVNLVQINSVIRNMPTAVASSTTITSYGSSTATAAW